MRSSSAAATRAAITAVLCDSSLTKLRIVSHTNVEADVEGDVETDVEGELVVEVEVDDDGGAGLPTAIACKCDRELMELLSYEVDA